MPGNWLVMGAVASLTLIWLLSLATFRLPDWKPQLFAIPAAMASYWLIQSKFSAWTQAGPFRFDVRRIASAILVATMLHLVVSGGWTVPGVCLIVWLSAALLCREPQLSRQPLSGVQADFDEDDAAKRASRSVLIHLTVGLLLLGALRFESISPVQTAELALARAEDARMRGLASRADSELQTALDADPWALEAARWKTEFLRQRIVGESDGASLRARWQESVEVVIERAGDNPLLLRSIGEQSLHFYQVYGRGEDLEMAEQRISEAAALNPTDLSLLAQLALIHLERGDEARGGELAAKVTRMSKLGNNIVRDLGLQQAMEVRPIGVVARNHPISRSIKVQFQERLPVDAEPEGRSGRSTGAQL